MGIKKIAIIGGGISGLAALHFIKKHHGDHVDVTLYERNAHAGGNIQTVLQDGFLFENGPNGFLNNQPTTFELIQDLNLNDQLITADNGSSRRYIQINGHLDQLPKDPLSFIQTPLLTFQDKCHVIKGLFNAKISTDQSVYDYVATRLGRGMAENFADPFVSGIFAGDIKRLHMASIFPKKTKKHKGRTQQYSFKQGMGTLIQTLEARCTKHIKFGVNISSIGDISADQIICTCPAYAASVLLKDHPVLCESLDAIPYAPVTVLGLAFPSEAFKNKPDGFGYLIPSHQRKDILGVLLESNVFADRAPQGMMMVRVMMGGRHHPEIINDDAQVFLTKALDELRSIYGLRKDPVQHWIKSWPKAIPQYELGYPEIINSIQKELKNIPLLTLSGNYLGGVSFNDCVNNAKTFAQSIVL